LKKDRLTRPRQRHERKVGAEKQEKREEHLKSPKKAILKKTRKANKSKIKITVI